MSEHLLGELVADRVYILDKDIDTWKFGMIKEMMLNYALTEKHYLVEWLDTKQEEWFVGTVIDSMKRNVPTAKRDVL